MSRPSPSPRQRRPVPGPAAATMAIGLLLAASGCTQAARPGPEATATAPLPRPSEVERHPRAEVAVEPVAAGTDPSRALRATVLQAGRRVGDSSTVVAAALPAAARLLGPAPRTHLVVEAVDQPGPGAAVVVVLGLEWDGVEVRTRRVAVPVLTTQPPQVGTPWELPAPATHDLVDLAAINDPSPRLRKLAVEALDRAGHVDVEVHAVAPALDAWPIVTTFTATVEGQRRTRTVWLRRHLDHLVVAGLPADARPNQEDLP